MRLRREKGFTLIETLITTVIVSVSMLAVASCFSKGLMLTTIIKENAVAACALQEQIEILREWSFNDVVTAYFPQNNFNSASLALLPSSTGKITVDYPILSSNMIIRVNAFVEWKSANGRKKTKSAVTMITSGGLEG